MKTFANFLKKHKFKLLAAAVLIAIIAIIPMFLRFTDLNIAFGGTSILIVVGVALETVQQLESQLVMRHYKGFLE